MDKFISQLWRFVRVSGVTSGVIAAVSTAQVSTDVKLVVAAISTGAVETAYRQLVPATERTKLGKLIAAVKSALREAEAATPAEIGSATAKVPA